MTGVVMIFHALICILLTVVILMQSGRGGGLTEAFASAESMFGAQTNELMIKATTVLSIVFLITCLGLAVLSSKKDTSLMAQRVTVPASLPLAEDIPAVEEGKAVAGSLSESTTGSPAVAAVDIPAVEVPDVPNEVPVLESQ